MLERVHGGEDEILSFIGGNFPECLYLYLDLKKYGASGEGVAAWVERVGGEITSVVLGYYTGMHVYCPEKGRVPEGLLELIAELAPAMVCAREDTIATLAPSLSGLYTPLYGSVGEITRVRDCDSSRVETLGPADFGEIADLLLEDEGLGGHYERELLIKQLTERYRDGMGRHKGIIIDGALVSHIATYAETDTIAVTSGFITAPRFRRRGLGLETVAALCRELLAEGKRVYSYYYRDAARALHEAAGFHDVCGWGKLTKI